MTTPTLTDLRRLAAAVDTATTVQAQQDALDDLHLACDRAHWATRRIFILWSFTEWACSLAWLTITGRYHPLRARSQDAKTARPHVTCICGSMRFQDTMLAVSVAESLAGRIVVLPLVNMRHPDLRWASEHQATAIKRHLDTLHLRKIDFADDVLVVNPGGYIGDSTRREIAYATERGKPVRYLVSAEHSATAGSR